MKVYTRDALVKRLKICMVLGVISMVASVVFTIGGFLYSGMEITIGMLLICVYAVLCIPVMGFSWFSLSLNFGKIMLGIIAPIPILSLFIEAFKGLYYGVRAIIVIVKKRDEFVIGQPEE